MLVLIQKIAAPVTRGKRKISKMQDKSPERLPLTDVFHSFHVCLYVHYKQITLLTKIFSARQRDIKMSLRRDSNLGELDFQGIQDEIAQKKIQKENFLPKLFCGRSLQNRQVREWKWSNCSCEKIQKIRILIWKKVQFEDLNQIMRKSWKKLSDNKKPWRKLFLKKKDGVHWCLGLLIQWFKITSRYSFLSLLVFLIK